jgi:hypothetical protein
VPEASEVVVEDQSLVTRSAALIPPGQVTVKIFEFTGSADDIIKIMKATGIAGKINVSQ